MTSNTPSLKPSRIVRIVLALLACVVAAQAQSVTPQNRGFQPGGSYAVGDIETINTNNGNLMLNLPLAALPPGRGGLGAKLVLTYNSKIWDESVNNGQNYQCPSGATCAPQQPETRTLSESAEGGWHYAYQYELQVEERDYQPPTSWSSQSNYSPCTDWNAVYYYRLMVSFPDGSKHEFRLQGQTEDDGYYKYMPDGRPSSYCSSTQPLTGTLTYYSVDGTYLRLDVEHDADTNWSNNPWKLYLPDGGRVTGGNANQRVYDRNDNYVEVQSIAQDSGYNNHPTVKLVDQLGRKVVIEYGSAIGQDSIHAWGVNNEEMVTLVKWKTFNVKKSYRPGAVSYFIPTNFVSMRVVDSIVLPAQGGGLSYAFGYNPGTSDPSYGWGELSSITLPSGATTSYQYNMDGQNQVYGHNVIKNSPTRKDLTHQQEYDNNSTQVTETWLYSPSGLNGGVGTITGPDGGITRETFDGEHSKKVETPDGTIVERDWRRNSPFGATYNTVSPGPVKDNYYVKSEFTSIRNASSALVKTAIKDYSYDKNGNVTRVKEYDWVDYSSVHDGGGNPVWTATRPAVQRETVTAYFNDTPDASDTATDDPDVYHKTTSPRKHDSAAWSEVKDATRTFARAEFTYDDPATRGNLTAKKSWDSTKGAYSSPLSPSNSVSVFMQYDSYGNPTLTTDAKGYQNKRIYGAVGGFTDLYPTTTEVAYGTTVKRTATSQYDFWTGLVTRSTDADNNVSTVTTYDVFGRPTLVKAAEGTSAETRAVSVYNDGARRVVVRSDLNAAGDGKLVSIQHYDWLGRVRLARTLENASTQSETDESAGIKVQTRYLYSGGNSYVLTSQPYRAATSGGTGEPTRGWTRAKSNSGGRVVEVQTFQGSALPAPWGANTSSTGAATTAYDAEFTTVADQAGKLRRSRLDGLGRLVRVDEPDANNTLGATTAPVQATSYTYDALGSLRKVDQGGQYRYFMYDSLGRLVFVRNPEQGANAGMVATDPVTNNSQWSLAYVYDANGNLTKKTDARGVIADYTYDELNRVKTVRYSGETGTATPGVDRFYDGATLGKGLLWKSQTLGASGTLTNVNGYDALGRALSQGQQFASAGVWGPSFNVQSAYDRAGHVLTQTYPSGRTATYAYDAAGRLASFSGALGDGVGRTYSSGVMYDEQSRMKEERFGTDTPVYNKHLYNSRGQLAEIRVSTYSITTQGQETNWNRGAIINHYSNGAGAWGATGGGPDNNGNLLRQEVYIPNDDQISGYFNVVQHYGYDSLNRLVSVEDKISNATTDFYQAYQYDRWGNRTINAMSTTGAPEPQYSVNTATNQLGVPSGQSGAMVYDPAGNLTTDTYQGGNGAGTSGGTRTYDAENRMTVAQFVSGQLQTATYTYDADGQRIKRNMGAGGEVWQVYGMDGELLAEYAPNTSPTSPQKEYGYRGGELLVTATASTGGGTGATFNAVTDYSSTQNPTGAWGYGYRASGGAYSPLPNNDNIYGFGAGMHTWYLPNAGWNLPTIFYNGTGATTTYATITQPTDKLNLHPGPNGERCVVRWTAPSAMTVQVAGHFEGLDSNGASSDASITHNGAQLFSANVTGSGVGSRQTFSLTRTVAAGDTLEFSAGYGTNGVVGDSTGLAVTITQGASSQGEVQWLVADQLGTPRMVIDKTGSLASVKRHDYFPFGEEIPADSNYRTSARGYAGDTVRQKFTGYERDNETGLDFAQNRYHSPTMGRFISVDPENASANPDDPQSWNGYGYARNNPLLYTDPDGRLYVIRRGDGSTEIITDAQFNQMKNNPNNGELGVIVKGGNIYNRNENGDMVSVGTYERVWFDDQDTQSNRMIWGLARMGPAMEKTILAFAAANLAPAVAIVGSGTLGGSTITTLGIAGGAKKAVNTIDDILKGATKGKVSKSIQYSRPGGFTQANKDFDAITRGANVTNRGNGLRTAQLPDGTKVNVRPFSSGSKVTLEIQPPSGKTVKIRYD